MLEHDQRSNTVDIEVDNAKMYLDHNAYNGSIYMQSLEEVLPIATRTAGVEGDVDIYTGIKVIPKLKQFSTCRFLNIWSYFMYLIVSYSDVAHYLS